MNNLHPIFQNIVRSFAPALDEDAAEAAQEALQVDPVQTIYDRLTAPSFDSAGYRIVHKATVADVETQLSKLLTLITERKAEIDAASGRNPQIVDEMRREWMAMAQNYDEAADELAALEPIKHAAE